MKKQMPQFMGHGKPQTVQLRTTDEVDPVKDLAIDVEAGKVRKDRRIRSEVRF